MRVFLILASGDVISEYWVYIKKRKKKICKIENSKQK